MLVIKFTNIPLSHLIFMPIAWISVFIYLRLIYIIHRNKKEFRSSFFVIVRLHAITDILMFLFVEFIARPRKYGIHNLIPPVIDNWLPQLIYFIQTCIKNTMFLGSVVVALNRFMTMLSAKVYNNIWAPTTILFLYFIEWISPSTYLIPMFYTGNHNFSFLPTSTGLTLRAEIEFMKLDALQDFIISSSCFVISSILYILIFIFIWKNEKIKKFRSNFVVMTSAGSSIFMKKSLTTTDYIIFKCAFSSFLFFIPNFVKTVILYSATDATVVNIATDLWYFTTELMCISSPWSLIISSQKLRKELLPKS